MFLMRADTLQGQVGGGWALEIKFFFEPREMAVPFGAQKTAPPPIQSVPLCTLQFAVDC
jgi:hypothetical protein